MTVCEDDTGYVLACQVDGYVGKPTLDGENADAIRWPCTYINPPTELTQEAVDEIMNVLMEAPDAGKPLVARIGYITSAVAAMPMSAPWEDDITPMFEVFGSLDEDTGLVDYKIGRPGVLAMVRRIVSLVEQEGWELGAVEMNIA
jgi:hypothetical protein